VTTAASLWITAAMGLAMGLGEYLLAAVAAGFTLVTLLVIGVWERSLERRD
jgi:putative Mg2+ transporter-C (MgtC) family protein